MLQKDVVDAIEVHMFYKLYSVDCHPQRGFASKQLLKISLQMHTCRCPNLGSTINKLKQSLNCWLSLRYFDDKIKLNVFGYVEDEYVRVVQLEDVVYYNKKQNIKKHMICFVPLFVVFNHGHLVHMVVINNTFVEFFWHYKLLSIITWKH